MTPTSSQARSDAAAAQLLAALDTLSRLDERKSGFNPDQPRVPAGQGHQSGQWACVADAIGKLALHSINQMADTVAHEAGVLAAPFRPAATALVNAAPPELRRFVSDNLDAIQRTLGAVQAIGGGAQIAEGVQLAELGSATLPEGAPALLAGAVLTAHGADDLGTGLRILATGQAEPGGFYTMLRGAGLDDNAATLALVTTSGLPPFVAAHVPFDTLQGAAEAALERDSLVTLFAKGKVITADGSSAFASKDIGVIGELTERDAHALYGGERTGPTFKTFDLLVQDGDGTVKAISVKSLNASTDHYLQDSPETMLPRMKAMITDVANFSSYRGRYRTGEKLELLSKDISERQLDLYLPAGVLVRGQHAQVATARNYAGRRNVGFVVHYIH